MPPIKKTDQPSAKRRKIATRSTGSRTLSVWYTLTPELLGRIATYLDIIGGDLTNYCIVVGPDTSRIVRHSVLHENDDYLRYCMSLERNAALRKAKVMCWMETNADNWKDRVGSISTVERTARGTQEETIHNAVPRAARTELRTDLATARCIRFRRSLGGLVAFGNWTVKLPDDINSIVQNGDTLVSINGLPLRRGLTLGVVDDLLQKTTDSDDERVSDETTVSLVFIKHPDTIFTNPGLAAKVGLDLVLRVMIEGRDMMPQLTSYRSADNFPLLWVALFTSPDMDSFLYLLTTELVLQSNEYENVIEEADTRVKLIHVAALNQMVPLHAFAALAQHPRVDVNAVETHGCSALHLVCGNAEDPDTKAKIRILLDAGADPTLVADNRTAVEMLRNEMVEVAEDDERNRSLKEAVALLERAGRRIARSRIRT